ncbi:ABC transporter G member 25 [Ancistrocladus abbreviatus]
MSVFGCTNKPPNCANGETSNGGDHFLDSRNHHHHLPSSLMSSCYPITLKFVDICYRVKLENNRGEGSIRRMICGGPRPSSSSSDGVPTAAIEQERTILNGITGTVSPGEILALLGPSGSGKSTLLNALAGRLHGPSLTGSILFNNKSLNRPFLKRTGFVTQDDVLYPHLTVRETLAFCALLRLPSSLSRREKISAAESVMSELGLSKCEHTVIGNSFIRGVSGGERKRVSIAHELLVNPSLLILDEPTSGLDSTAAYRMVATLSALAKKGKTVVTSVHQPSSRVYQLFDSVLVLSEGRSLYFGKGSDAMSYFESIGFSMSFPMNPADFLLDLANGVSHIDAGSEKEKPNMKQTLISSYNNILAPKIIAACSDNTQSIANEKEMGIVRSHEQKEGIKTRISTWFDHFTILLHRSLKERRHESFNSLRILQVFAAAMLGGIMWWHSDYRAIQDRLGLIFFFSIFWGVFPSFNAVFAFPQDRAIFTKERAAGMYTLSPYFMARIVGDLPMELVLPVVFVSVIYWMTDLKPELVAFLLTQAVVIGYVLVAQGLGLAVGAIIMDAKKASTLVTVIMLAFVLTGGFYVQKIPRSFAWIKYISCTFYCYRLLIYVQYGDGKKISSLLGCSQHWSSDAASCRFIQDSVAGQISMLTSIVVLLFMFVGFRLLAYFALRRIK